VGAITILCLAAGWRVSHAGQGDAKPLSEEPLLQRAVSFTARAEPLPSVLRTLSGDAGPQLRLGPELEKAGCKVTAVVKELPLHEAMGALAHLYQAQWKREQGAYVMAPSDLQGFERELQRIGDPDWFGYRAGMAARQEREQVPLDIEAALAPEQQTQFAGQGVPFRALPTELQDRVIQVAQGTEGRMRVEHLRRAMMDVIGRGPLHIQTPKRRPDGRQDPPTMSVIAGGSTVADLPWVNMQ